MSQPQWKNRLVTQNAYSRIALQTDNFEYFTARQTLSATTSLLDQHIKEAGSIKGYGAPKEKKPLDNEAETALLRKHFFEIAQETTSTIQNAMESLTEETSRLIRSCLQPSVDRVELKAKLQAKSEEMKKVVNDSMDEALKKVMTVIEEAPADQQGRLADMWMSVADGMMATIAKLMKEHSATVSQAFQFVEQILQLSDDSKTFTQTMVEALVSAVKIMLYL